MWSNEAQEMPMTKPDTLTIASDLRLIWPSFVTLERLNTQSAKRAAAAITKGELKISNCRLEDMMAVVDVLRNIGIEVDSANGGCVTAYNRQITAADITTLPYPGFPTDLQAQMMAFATRAKGISVVTERVYPDRFMHVSELMRMGAQLIREGPRVVVKGGVRLSGAPVMASDLRASAALVLAGLVARGKTEISRVYHLDRGYERMESKLEALGARITRRPE